VRDEARVKVHALCADLLGSAQRVLLSLFPVFAGSAGGVGVDGDRGALTANGAPRRWLTP
jgi:hypothetical protein